MCVALLAEPASGTSSLERTTQQSRPATYADIHAQQALGRVIVAPDGQFILYEWGHPYLDWVPDVKWMAPSAARRMETFLFKVDLGTWQPTSEYLFAPRAGATYWLGDLSPDGTRVVLFELDHDSRTVRAGVCAFLRHQMHWFVPRPDEGKLEALTAWISNEEFLYPAKDGSARLVRANAVTGEAAPCAECTVETLRTARVAREEASAHALEESAKLRHDDVPSGAKLVGGSPSGDLAVYVKDDLQVLMMVIKRRDRPAQVVFENSRQWPRPRNTGAK
jgi:hypothetical protein